MMQKKSSIYFPHLDSLRFIAFALVFFQHGFYNAFSSFEGKNYLLNRIISLFFLGGGTGVQIFFVLSGFLITYLIKKEVDDTGRLNIKYFYMRRTLRIWPLYYVVILFSFVIYPYLKSLLGIVSDLCSQPFYYFTFLANFDLIRIAEQCPGKDAMIQGIVWSVSIEEQFYLVWPLLFFIVPVKRVILLPIGVLLMSIIFRLNHALEPDTLYYHTLSVCGDLAIGGLLAILMINKGFLYKWIVSLKIKHIQLIYIAILCTYIFHDHIHYPYSHVFQRYWFALCWGFIILEQNFNLNNNIKLGKINWMNKWGKYTYGLYMLHPIGILIVDIITRMLHVEDTGFIFQFSKGCLALVASMLIAYISFHYMELYFLRLKNKFTVIGSKVYRAAA